MQTDGMLVAGALRIDQVERRVTVDGEPVRLGGKAFDMLLTLALNAGRLVTKQALIDAVWEGRAVSETVLTTAAKEIRHALGDDARAPRYIETVHGHGYRFLPSLEMERAREEAVESPATGPADARRRFLASGAGLAAIAAAAAVAILLIASSIGRFYPSPLSSKSVVVAPFENLSPDDKQDWFAGGLTEELLTTLARAADLEVASAADHAAGGGATPAQIANERGVAHVLHGSVRRGDGRVRVAAQLLRARDGVIVWSQSYDRPDADMIGIQEEIAFEIARALRTVANPEQLQQMVEVGTKSVEAYEAFLAGQHLMSRQYATGDATFRKRAYESYEKARLIDPAFSEAHWLAARYWFEQSTVITPLGAEELSGEAISAAFAERIEAAVATAPDEAARMKYEAARHLQRLEIRAAQRLFTDYLAARPRDPYAWVQLARAAAFAGDFETGRKAAEALAKLSDKHPLYMSRTIPPFTWTRDFEGAAREARRLAAKAPDDVFVRYHAHRALLWVGEKDAAARLLPKIEASDMPLHNRRLAALRQACASGDAKGARAIAEELYAAEGASLATRWLAMTAIGDKERARGVLAPLDRPETLYQLAGWLIYPRFDEAEYPALKARLDAEGIARARMAEPRLHCGI